MSDTLAYSIILPIIPFQLERMGYRDVPSRVGWLLFAYVCCFICEIRIQLIYPQSAGLVICDSVFHSIVERSSDPGCFIATPFLVSCSERLKSRQIPLMLSLISLILSQLLFILGRRYWVLCVARVIKGISSSGVLSVGLALM